MIDALESDQTARFGEASSRRRIAARAAAAVVAAYTISWHGYGLLWSYLDGLTPDPCIGTDDILCAKERPYDVVLAVGWLALLAALFACYAAWERRRSGSPALRVLAGASVSAAVAPFLMFTLMRNLPLESEAAFWLVLLGTAVLLGALAARLPGLLFLACAAVLAALSLLLTVQTLASGWFVSLAVVPGAGAVFFGAAFVLRLLDSRTRGRGLGLPEAATPLAP